MKSQLVRTVEFNNRKRAFEVGIEGRDRTYLVPYGMANVEGFVKRVEVDRETGRAGFVWTTHEGVEGAMLAEEVLWVHRDPDVRHEHLLYELTLEALQRKKQKNVGIRSLATMMGTSPARVQLLLQPTVYRHKSVKAMLVLLSALGAEVVFRVRDRDAALSLPERYAAS